MRKSDRVSFIRHRLADMHDEHAQLMLPECNKGSEPLALRGLTRVYQKTLGDVRLLRLESRGVTVWKEGRGSDSSSQ